ncbi:hypothetical protein BH11PSE1_BH11PSE1_10530 [soil metagenome]
MNAHTPILTPLALENIDVLRALALNEFPSRAGLAMYLGRDPSNVGKTLKSLHAAELLDGPTWSAKPTDSGQAAIDAMARAEGRGEPSGVDGYVQLSWLQIRPDPLNPRKHFDPEAIGELADSIARDGLLENLVVRPLAGSSVWTDFRKIEAGEPGEPVYSLVAGERRYRAIKELIDRDAWDRMAPIMCKVVEIDDAAHRRIALVENLQRKDLRPVDEAQALKELMAVTGVGTAEVAKEIGFTQRFVQQRLQLLELPADKQDLVNTGVWTIEQARRSVASLPKPIVLTPANLLLLAEIACRVTSAKKLRPGMTGIVGGSVRADDAAEKLRGKGLVYVTKNYTTGEDSVQLNEVGIRSLDEALPGFSADPWPVMREFRERAGLPIELEAMHAAKQLFLTPWLNEPYELHHTEVTRLDNEAKSRVAAEERQAREATVHAERGALGASMLGAVRELEARAPNLGHVAFIEAFRALAQEIDAPGPWRLTMESGQHDPHIVDATGKGPSGTEASLEARRRLIALAVNYAAGFQATTGPDLPTDWAARGDATSEPTDEPQA